jgi:hypothetical protein
MDHKTQLKKRLSWMMFCLLIILVGMIMMWWFRDDSCLRTQDISIEQSDVQRSLTVDASPATPAQPSIEILEPKERPGNEAPDNSIVQTGASATATGMASNAKAPAQDASADFFTWVEQMQPADPDQALAQASNLWNQDLPLFRALGYAILQKHNLLTSERLAQMASNETLMVSFTVLEWMRDAGHEDVASELEIILRGSISSPDALLDALSSGELELGGNRAAIWMLRHILATPEQAVFYHDLAADKTQDYETRARALLEAGTLCTSVDFKKMADDFRLAVEEDPVASSLERLASQVMSLQKQGRDGPLLTAEDIQSFTQDVHPYQLEELALLVEYVADHWASALKPGTCAALYEKLESFNQRLHTPQEIRAYYRLLKLKAQLQLIEQSRWTEDLQP